MNLYTPTILSFLKNTNSYIKEIINNETPFQMKRSRVFINGYYYPLKTVVFEHQSIIGYYESSYYTLGLNKSLIYQAKLPILKDIIRHELAHFFAAVLLGKSVQNHGKEYHDLCRSFGWGENVWKAKINLNMENEKIEGDLKTEKLIGKIKKLMSLGESSNIHEAELATLKANQLLLQYNLDENSKFKADEFEICVARVFHTKRFNSKASTILSILKHFFVAPVINTGVGESHIEVTGTRANVQMAHYVAKFLDKEIDSLWGKLKKENSELKGLKAKNNFILGIADGYDYKMKSIKKEYKTHSKDLIKIEENLNQFKHIVYGGSLGSLTSKNSYDDKARSLGIGMGKKLSISKPLNQGKKSGRLLSWMQN